MKGVPMLSSSTSQIQQKPRGKFRTILERFRAYKCTVQYAAGNLSVVLGKKNLELENVHLTNASSMKSELHISAP